jgi:hypothetical protein
MSRVEETLLFHIGVTVMKVPAWVKPGVWGGVVGAIAIMIVGFWQIGWTTAGTAERMATDRANSAVVAVLVPFCVAMAERDPDQAKLAKVKAEQSNWSRSQLVSDAGWATMPRGDDPRYWAGVCMLGQASGTEGLTHHRTHERGCIA